MGDCYTGQKRRGIPRQLGLRKQQCTDKISRGTIIDGGLHPLGNTIYCSLHLHLIDLILLEIRLLVRITGICLCSA